MSQTEFNSLKEEFPKIYGNEKYNDYFKEVANYQEVRNRTLAIRDFIDDYTVLKELGVQLPF